MTDLQAQSCSNLGPHALTAGYGRLEVARVAGRSAVVACAATSPLKIFTPRPFGAAAWAIATTHGGGVLAGDRIDLEIDVGTGASALLSTQSNTRVHRSGGPFSAQRLTARLQSGSTLVALPEPTTCFGGARHRQEQRFSLEPGASLLFLDALTEGRSARGERWAFDAYLSRNVVQIGSRVLLADGLRLVANEAPALGVRMGGAAMIATLVAIGPEMSAGARRLLGTHANAEIDRHADVLAAASPIADGVCLKLAARTVAAGHAFLRRSLELVAPAFAARPLGHRP